MEIKYFREFIPNKPVSLEEAIKAEADSSLELEAAIKARHPKMVGNNVMVDDLYIYLIANPDGCIQAPYVIEKSRLDETDWFEHLSEKGWVDNDMLADFRKIQTNHKLASETIRPKIRIYTYGDLLNMKTEPIPNILEMIRNVDRLFYETKTKTYHETISSAIKAADDAGKSASIYRVWRDPLTKKTIGRCAVHQCGELLCTIGQADKMIKEFVVKLHAN